jgi:hypothetical protein
MLPEPIAASPMAGSSLTQSYEVALPLKLMAVVFAPTQTAWSEGFTTDGVGFTVMVKFFGVPLHVPNLGVTVIVAVIGVVPAFTPLNDAMSPVPDAARPIPGALFAQSNVAPEVPAKVIAVVGSPTHTTSLGGVVTVGVGSTVIVNEVGVPLHSPKDGVTVIFAVTGADPVLVAVNAPMLPVPLAASPMEGVSLIHE